MHAPPGLDFTSLCSSSPRDYLIIAITQPSFVVESLIFLFRLITAAEPERRTGGVRYYHYQHGRSVYQLCYYDEIKDRHARSIIIEDEAI